MSHSLIWDARNVPYAEVAIRHDGGACKLSNGLSEDGIATPAELRAALERLAGERK